MFVSTQWYTFKEIGIYLLGRKFLAEPKLRFRLALAIELELSVVLRLLCRSWLAWQVGGKCSGWEECCAWESGRGCKLLPLSVQDLRESTSLSFNKRPFFSTFVQNTVLISPLRHEVFQLGGHQEMVGRAVVPWRVREREQLQGQALPSGNSGGSRYPRETKGRKERLQNGPLLRYPGLPGVIR